MKQISSPGSWQVIFLSLLVIGILLLAISGYLGPALRIFINPLVGIQTWFSNRYLAIYEFVTIPRDYATIQQRNLELENEMSRLQTKVIELQQQLREAQILYALLDFARARPENQYIAAAVIGQDPSPFLRYVIIDHGSDDGLRHGMPVVTEQGLVGRVDAVTAGAARIQLITDPGFAVNVHLLNSQTYAMQVGSLTGDISLEMIPQEIIIQPGDLVLTSGLGGDYPSDVVVGQIVTIRRQENGLFQSAAVQPAVNFTNLRAVLVIMNFKPVNIKPLVPTTSP